MSMDTFKSYFEYKIFGGCGIRQITLAGTEQDWNELWQRVKQFSEYGLEEWGNALDPIIEQFCLAKLGHVDGDF